MASDKQHHERIHSGRSTDGLPEATYSVIYLTRCLAAQLQRLPLRAACQRLAVFLALVQSGRSKDHQATMILSPQQPRASSNNHELSSSISLATEAHGRYER